MDFGKFVARSLGIGEQSVDEAVRVGASILSGDVVGGTIAASQLLASEKDRSRQREATMYPNPNVDYLRTYQSPGTDDLGGITDMSPSGTGGVYEGSIGGLITQGVGQISRILGGRLATGAGIGAAATGVVTQMNGDACGCKPKVFVRLNNCGQPVITRKMKQQAIEAVKCMGPEVAAATLTGGSLELLTMIISKSFPPRKMGITGAQMSTTEKTQRKLMRFHKRMTEACKPKARGR
jgi:hypothetical protein